MSKVLDTTTTAKSALEASRLRRRASKGFFVTSFSRFFRSKLNIFALTVFVIIAIASFSADIVARITLGKLMEANANSKPYEVFDFDLLTRGLQPPVGPGVGGHFLGTDELGRDIFVRLLYGGQVSLQVGFLVALIAIFVGTSLGLLGGYFGGWVDDLVNALVQIVFNIPGLFLLIILSVFFKPDALSISVTIGLLLWGGLTRQVRGAVMSLRNREYIEAARVIGAGNSRILLTHMLPNVISLMLVVAGFDIATGILIESALSFLGFGISVPIPSWGNMLSDSQSRFTSAPWMVYAPALAIFLTVLCVFLIADGLRDAFDPRLKGR